MASSGDDADDNGYLLPSDDQHPNRHGHPTPHQYLPHHHPQPPAYPTRFPSKSSPSLPSVPAVAASNVAESGDEGPFHDAEAPFAAATDDFVSPADPARSLSDKRRSNEEVSDGGTAATAYACKRSRLAASANSEYRKDREEWSDTAIACLLEAYTEKYMALNRGNLRGRDWEEVAAIVSERCEKPRKSVEQCKNKVDNLKKRFKLERHRMSSGVVSASHWPWYKKLEEIVSNTLPAKSATEDDKAGDGGVGLAALSRQSKRNATVAPCTVGPLVTVKSKSTSNPRWRRVVFKISGAALACSGQHNIDPKVTMSIAREVALACRLGVQVAIVVGGRNFFCGNTWVTATGLDRCTTYQIGMMATVMNSVLLQSALEKMGVHTRVQSPFPMHEVTEPYSRQRAIRHLEKGRVVIFGGIGAGTGNPLFSTDTAAAHRASEIHAEALLKGTNADGFYDCNSQDNNLTFEHITFRDLVSWGATSMDMTALTFCEDNGIPVVVFNLLEAGNISRALCGEEVGTLIDHVGRNN
ncbi:hypothetical protein MLD38_035450 [Melastoma candidum]|uniref:Uncharacterized protein n=1 Tax=Melastoma candidum TaxID=119954 RepID=A0ACB9LH77_9MYRT|nr:hypothetical protein MLD38_035450 [Melastoma candidum]